MKCPFCRRGNFEVTDTRTNHGGFPIRRRRRCSRCGRRVWSVEVMEENPLHVVKKDQSREPFDRTKILRGLEKACYKRPVSQERLEELVGHIEQEIYRQYDREVPSQVIGELVMKYLKELDQVAYVRFASVYREFKDVSEFVEEVKPMLNRQRCSSYA
ncbi:MAG: transcriptional regulator NrdR [Gemmatales bacterium]|nr:transcriptional regulator NrdR [Gemmatales bacterium]MCS7159743.1 transcriptional regulator NrdR [Gemmatales bacterium]MDW8174941.1 transcriptional regulator NrdR [Gemmatales bacterium]MDW8221339.1 transcriptional regulator NrdR [Gemmatales bacterium]